MNKLIVLAYFLNFTSHTYGSHLNANANLGYTELDIEELDEEQVVLSAEFNVSNHHEIKNFSIGYGIGIAHNQAKGEGVLLEYFDSNFNFEIMYSVNTFLNPYLKYSRILYSEGKTDFSYAIKELEEQGIELEEVFKIKIRNIGFAVALGNKFPISERLSLNLETSLQANKTLTFEEISFDENTDSKYSYGLLDSVKIGLYVVI